MDMVKMGRFLSELRKNHNFTQAELGEKLGITNLPVTIVYKDGKEVGRTTKVDSVDSMKTWIEGLTK